MEFLHELIQSLTPAEVKGVRAELKLRKTSPTISDLFEELLKLKDFSNLPDLKMFQDIKRQKKLHACESNLREFILDYLISSENLNKNKEVGELDKARLLIRQKLNHYHYLIIHKNHLRLNSLVLEDVIALAKKFENYMGIIEGLRYKRHYRSTRFGFNEYKKIEMEIEYFKECDTLLQLAERYFIQVNSENIFNPSRTTIESQDHLRTNLAYLHKALSKVQSSSISYFVNNLELIYYTNNKNYEKIRELALEKVKLLETNKAIYHKLRIGIAYDELATSEIILGNFELGFHYAKKAEEYCIKKSYNYWSSKGFQLLALFYCKKRNEAEIIIDLALKERRSIDKHKYSTFLIFKAYTLFAQQNFKQALKVLSQPLELTSDKTGWDITVRVLTIMTLTELNHQDEATQHIDRLRKHIERYSKKDFVTDRNITITNLLRTLARHEFNFKHPSLDRYLRLLRSPAQAWKPLTPELIPVEDWISGS